MPRVPDKPRYFASLGGYYIQLNRQRVPLAKGPKNDPDVLEEAWRQFRAVMQSHNAGTLGDRNTCFAVVNAYMVWAEKHRCESTVTMRRDILQSFVDHCGAVEVRQLMMEHIEAWLDKMTEPHPITKGPAKGQMVCWSSSTRTMAIRILNTAFRWAKERKVGQGGTLIRTNPIVVKHLAPEPIPSRGRESRLDDEQLRIILEYANRRKHKGFYNLLQCLNGTGARPAEVYLAKASEFDEQRGTWVIQPIEANKGRLKKLRKGKPRVIVIPTELIPLVKELNTKYPTGPIFRNESDEPWTGKRLNNRFRRMRRVLNGRAAKRGDKPPLRKITAYSIRHKFCTDWLRAGKNAHTLCAIVDTSLKMLHEHYGHVGEHIEDLRKDLEEFRTGGAAQGNGSAFAFCPHCGKGLSGGRVPAPAVRVRPARKQ